MTLNNFSLSYPDIFSANSFIYDSLENSLIHYTGIGVEEISYERKTLSDKPYFLAFSLHGSM